MTFDQPRMFNMSLQAHVANIRARAGATWGDALVARRHLAAITGGRCSFDVSRSGREEAFRSAQVQLDHGSLQTHRWDFDSDCITSTQRSAGEHFVFYLVLTGKFEASRLSQCKTVRPGQLLMASAPGKIARTWHGGCDLVNIVIPRQRLADCLASEFRLDIDAINFDPLALLDMSATPTLVSALEMVLADLASESPAFADRQLAGSVERLICQLLLKSLINMHGRVPDARASRAAPFYVRRAEKHMIANLHSGIGMEELVAVAGVSARTLYYGFRKYRYRTPMRHLKHLRLDRARQELVAAGETGEKISLVAARVGYSSASQFSNDYKAQYGVSPQGFLRTSGR